MAASEYRFLVIRRIRFLDFDVQVHDGCWSEAPGSYLRGEGINFQLSDQTDHSRSPPGRSGSIRIEAEP